MVTARNVMDVAIRQVGVKEVPANSNNVIYNTDYYGRTVNGAGYAWCCTFVWDIFRMANASYLFYDGQKTAYCPAVETWGRKNKLIVPNDQGEYGDIVLFQFDSDVNADHIGLIYSKNQDGSYTTIEGNTSLTSNDSGGSVMKRIRKPSLIKCIIRPSYDGEKNTVTDNKKTAFIKGVQKACGASVDGIAGKETLSKTITVSSRVNKKHLVVKDIQTYLNYLGYNCGTVDGIAGSKFTTAVKAFQRANGCIIDGEITARNKTWKRLLGIL